MVCSALTSGNWFTLVSDQWNAALAVTLAVTLSHIGSHIYVRRYRLEHFTFTQTLPPHGNGSLRSIYINTGIIARVIRGHNKVMFTIATNDVFLMQNRHHINMGTLFVCSMSNNILFVECACVHALTDPIPRWPTGLFRVSVA